MSRPIEAQETRLQREQRGWHRVKNPPFHALDAKLKRVAKNNGETKMAFDTDAALNVLRHFGSGAKRIVTDPGGAFDFARRRAPALLSPVSPETKANIAAHILGSAAVPLVAGYGLYRGVKHLGRRKRAAVKVAAVQHVLSKFALLDEAGDPIVEMTRIIKDDDFGYTKRTAENKPQMRNEKPVWGPAAGLGAGWTADQLGAIRNESYGGV